MGFPAAHSMDTDWFAVDEDGHVALFVSGEPGAVPERGIVWCGPGGDEDGREAFWRAVGLRWLDRLETSPPLGDGDRALLACSTRAAADAAVEHGAIYLAERNGKHWLVWPLEDPPELDDAGVELIWFGSQRDLFETAGVFVYEADYDDGPTGVYHRVSGSEAAAVAPAGHELGPDAPAHRLPVRFASAPELNVGQLVRAYSWTHEMDPDHGVRVLGSEASTPGRFTVRGLIVLLLVLAAVALLLVLSKQ